MTVQARIQTLQSGFLARPQQLYIDGHWQAAQSEETFDVFNPATGQVFAQAAAGASADIDLAVRAARRAFDSGPWSKMNGAQRTHLLWKLAELISANADELALLESLDNGKPLGFARMVDMGGAPEILRYNAGWATKLTGETIPVSVPGEHHAYTVREPVGVVGQIVPWNFPMLMAVGKLAPALAAGCTIVLKPAEQTPLTTVRLTQLIEEAGFPPGVFNLVTGLGEAAGKALVEHPLVDKISFTGSTSVGKSIMAAASRSLKRVTLELGGKSPTFIFADADLDRAIAAAAQGIFSNAGQVCVAGSRLYVHRKVYEQVLEGITQRARQLRVGPGTDEGTEIGPLVSAQQRDRVMGFIESGRREGAQVLVGGDSPDSPGYFVNPTVLAQTTAQMTVFREEIFGPVLSAMVFDDEDLDTLAERGNDTPYGLAASVWTRDISTAHKLARKLKAGSIKVNTPFGMDFGLPFGGFKESGIGRENGHEGVLAYTETKSVIIGL